MRTPCDELINGNHYCHYEDNGVSESERCRVCCGLGVDEDPYPDDYEDDYCPSATNGDYSPSNPWDAPGMSIRDFI